MKDPVAVYIMALPDVEKQICSLLAGIIASDLNAATGRIWHGHPVWFLEKNPIVGFSQQKVGIRLMFWSGQDFGEPELDVFGGKFRDASRFYRDASEVNTEDLKRWLRKAAEIQWDYRNLVKRKGHLERLK